MAYTDKNQKIKRQRALEMTKQYYEPGRQDRCYKWVWHKYIRPEFHVEYPTYLAWIRRERREERLAKEKLQREQQTEQKKEFTSERKRIF